MAKHRTPTTVVDDTDAVPLDAHPAAHSLASAIKPPAGAMSLFWRTFLLLAVLLLGSILAWLQTWRSLELEPRARQTAQQLASQVNLSRAALVHADAIARISLLKTMAQEEGLRIVVREPDDRIDAFGSDTLSHTIHKELLQRLGANTTMASAVNGQKGLWIGFDIDGDDYWLLADEARFDTAGGKTWTIWLFAAAALSLAGAAAIASLINRPLKQLSFAASRVREGDFDASMLDEEVYTSEIREVNMGFNRMAQQLAKVEQERAVMLAGISHDLRTPLARLRLETELSVSDLDARAHMAADIAQLDAVIDKFLDYARPGKTALENVDVDDVIFNAAFPFEKQDNVNVHVDTLPGLQVMADRVELGRVVSNLLENACRYGKSPDTGVANIDITARPEGEWVHIKVRDHGLGVAPEQLAHLTQPFFRGQTARTAANGAGLGLAIVEKTVQRMGGQLWLANSTGGGLAVRIRLKKSG
ncbi:ATP-binding protein [Curvibacter sp. APW13]|uniref:sensor histidine kinase n=1 Tax=Curvibacter sp. APW13 TaxID=3077236 RepID=UPI0039656E80